MNKEIPAEIRTFLENMVYASEEFDKGEVIPDQLLQELYGKLNDYLSTYLLSSLPSDKLSEYKTLNEKGAPPEILDVFSMKNIPNYSEVIKKAYQEFYNNYLAQMKEDRTRNL